MTTELKKPLSAEAKRRAKWKDSAKKWGRATVDTGMTMIPTALFVMQRGLRISPTEMNILVQIASAWWKVKKLPFLKKTTIGERIDLDGRNVQKHIKSLVAKGLLKVEPRYGTHGGRLSNAYDLKPLAEKLKPLALKMAENNKKGGPK